MFEQDYIMRIIKEMMEGLEDLIAQYGLANLSEVFL